MNEIHITRAEPIINVTSDQLKLELEETRKLLERIQCDSCCITLREKIYQIIEEIAALQEDID